MVRNRTRQRRGSSRRGVPYEPASIEAEERLVYPDLMRILAIFAVVFLHIAAGLWVGVEVQSKSFVLLTIYDGLFRFGVPLFVMLSGMFLLNEKKSISIRTLYTKRIRSIVITFIAWSLLYAFISSIGHWQEMTGRLFLEKVLLGHFHLWFLYMIIGLYIITPFLRLLVQKGAPLIPYFLLLWFIFNSCIPTLLNLFPSAVADGILNKMQLHYVLGYTGYYILGHYLVTSHHSRRSLNLFYLLGILSAILTVVLTVVISRYYQQHITALFSYFAPNIVMMSIAIFLFCKNIFTKIEFTATVRHRIHDAASYVFGIYLIHAFFLPPILNLPVFIHPIFYVPLLSVIIFLLSYAILFYLNKIPIYSRKTP